MKRQRGQSAVEFALISPIIFLLIFAAIYGGAMFIQFMNLSNEARTIARQIAITANATEQNKLKADYEEAWHEFAGLYKINMDITGVDKDGNVINDVSNSSVVDVVVTVNFTHGEFPFGFPPSHFALKYRMQKESATSST